MGRAQSNTQQLRDRCEQKLGIQFRSGKEQNGWFVHNGRRIARVTIPLGRKPLLGGTFSSMARQLYLTSAQLDDLIDCPLGLTEYLAELQKRGEIT
jgi:hypothetical protein